MSESTAPGPKPRHLVVLSADDDEGLRAAAARVALEASSAPLDAVCARALHADTRRLRRLALSAATADELRAKLGAFAEGRPEPGLSRGAHDGTSPRVAFLFTGQGSQYVGMGRELYETSPIFARTLDACAQAVSGVLDVPLVDVILGRGGAPGLIDQTLYTQPALFALEYSLATLLGTWGLTPDLVMGHSVGEYVAACLAGVFSLEDGIALLAARARLMQSLPPGGKMSAVATSPEAALEAIAPYAGEVSLAAANGDEAAVISGVGERVTAIGAELAARGVKVTPLTVSHAFHSPLLEPVLDELEQAASRVRYALPRIDLVSNVTGRLAGDEVCSPSYWRRHTRQAVLFASGVRAAHERGCRVFVELGPNPVLLGMARPLLPPDTVMLPTLRRRRGDWQQLLDAVAELYVRGAPVRAESVQPS